MADPLSLYDDMVLSGAAPDPATFCASLAGDDSLLQSTQLIQDVRELLQNYLRSHDASVRPVPKELGPFALLRPLGRGGMGEVFLARQAQPARLVALKLLNAELAGPVARFEREAALAARLHHPTIATVYAAGASDGYAYIAMELVHGVSLAQLMRASVVAPRDEWLVATLRELAENRHEHGANAAPLPVATALHFAARAADGLAVAHAQHIVHRDIKPSNLMITWAGDLKIIDFGLAIAPDIDPHLTSSGAFIGTFHYAAPEQLRGERSDVGPWSDTYALATTLYEMLTQNLPFTCASYHDRLALAQAPPEHGPRHFNSDVPRSVDALLRKALAPDPRDRFQDGEDFADALQACMKAPARSTWRAARAPQFRGVAHPAVVLLAVLVVVLGGWLWQLHADTQQRQLQDAHESHHRDTVVLAWSLEQAREALGQCLVGRVPASKPTRSTPRYEALLAIEHGRVTNVQTSTFLRVIDATTEACLTRTLTALTLPGVGLAAAVALPVAIDLQPAAKPSRLSVEGP